MVKISKQACKSSNLHDRGANVGTTRNEIGKIRGPSHLFKMSGFPLLPFLIHFRFSPAHSLPVFFLSCLIARSPRQGGCRRCWLLSLPLFVACCSEGASPGGCSVRPGQTLGRRYGGVFGENTRFFVYIDILGVTGHEQLGIRP